MAKYLRQLKSGHIYIWTPELAKRKDMVPLEAQSAEKRIQALQQKLAEQQTRIESMRAPDGSIKQDEDAMQAAELAKRLTELEAQSAALDKQEREVMEGITDEDAATNLKEKLSNTVSEEEIAEAQKKEAMDNDPEIMEIRGMRTKNQVEEYVLREYGEEIDRRKTVPELKAYAEGLRWERMQEGH